MRAVLQGGSRRGLQREGAQGSSAAPHTLTHEDEPGAGQLRPLKEGVEHVLAFALQLVQLIQHQEAVGEPRSTPALSPHSTPSKEGRAAASLPLLASRGIPLHPPETGNSHHGPLGRQMLLQAPDPLPASGHGQPQVLCQGREDALGAAQCHAVQHHSLAPGQLILP